MASRLTKLSFYSISFLGTPFFYAPLILFFWQSDRAIAARLIATLFLVELVCNTVKMLFPKDRPIPVKRARSILFRHEGNSFPSVHSARIIAVSMMLAKAYGLQLIAPGLLISAAVGYSRIYLKKHFLIDVIGGYLISAIISFIVLAMGET